MDEDRLWVIEEYVSSNPRLQIYELLSETDKSYLVKVGCGSRRLLKSLIGVRFYRYEVEAICHLRARYEQARHRAIRKAKQMAYLRDSDNQFVIAYARGVDSAVFTVDLAVQNKAAE